MVEEFLLVLTFRLLPEVALCTEYEQKVSHHRCWLGRTVEFGPNMHMCSNYSIEKNFKQIQPYHVMKSHLNLTA